MSWRLIEELSEITEDQVQKSKNEDFKKIQKLYQEFIKAKSNYENYLLTSNGTLDSCYKFYKQYVSAKKAFESLIPKIFKDWSLDR